MTQAQRPIILATRGSPLARAQTDLVLARCRAAFPHLRFEVKTVRTTGDKLQTAALAQRPGTLPKGLFTKELEQALLRGEADLAVHSLKDLPTDLPEGLVLAAVCKRDDPRDALIRRVPLGKSPLGNLPTGAVVATSSTRRRAQLLALRGDLEVVEIRGNVGTRLQKLAEDEALDALVLAAAGLARLGIRRRSDGRLVSSPASRAVPHPVVVPDGLFGVYLAPRLLLPCVGQGAIGIEARAGDERVQPVCRRLEHPRTRQCVTAERAFLRAMGGGCQSPVAAYAKVVRGNLHLRAISFRGAYALAADCIARPNEAQAIGTETAALLLNSP